MKNEEDYASDTDESDEDFRPDNLAGESEASEEEPDDSEDSEGGTEDVEETNGKLKKRRNSTTNSNKKKKSKTKVKSETDDLHNYTDLHAARRATRQTDSNINGKGKTIEKDELESDEENESRTNALWADFLKDVKPETAAKAAKSKSNTIKTNDKPSSSSSINGKDHTEKTHDIKSEVKAKSSITAKEEIKKMVVTEIVDFAGEEVRIQREVDPSSIKENKAASTQPPKIQPFGRIMPGAGGLKRISSNPSGAGGSSAGLGSFLNQLGKKKKISVLEKSQMDWKNFKEDEGIDEQLQTFNKGKDGYLERQDFLQRTDLRQFEIEKNLRQTTRRPH